MSTAETVIYEVQVRKGGRWLIDCRLEHEDQAVQEAYALTRRREIEAVKVVCERYRDHGAEPETRVLFHSAWSARRAVAKARGGEHGDDGPSGSRIGANVQPARAEDGWLLSAAILFVLGVAIATLLLL